MRLLLRSAPVLLVMGAALAGCNRPPGEANGGPDSTLPEVSAAHPVVLDISDMH
jgi:hypothetical protein